MEQNLAAQTAAALKMISERLNKMESRQIAADLWIDALMRSHPDPAAALDVLQASLDQTDQAPTPHPDIERAAQARTRRMLDLYRQRFRTPDEQPHR